MKPKKPHSEIAQVFFKLGCIAFGGPAAHIAMMDQEIIRKRKWMSSQHFLDLIGATNLIPGPNSTEMTMHCGYERGGWKGLFLAGGCFIFPAVVLTSILAWLYQTYGTLPAAEPYLLGIKPAVIAIILFAGFKLGKKAVKSNFLWAIAGLAIVLCYLQLNEIKTLLICGTLGLLYHYATNRQEVLSAMPLLFFYMAEADTSKLLKIGLTFLKVGSILYGSGYVLFAFLDTELVSTGLMEQSVLMDAIAVGQMTPGPVLSTATFIGWQLGGWQGAIIATVGIFLPAFVFVGILNPLIPKLSNIKPFRAFLDAVNVAAVALIIFVAFDMAWNTLSDWRTILIALLSIICVFFFRSLNSVYVIIGGSIIGWALSHL